MTKLGIIFGGKSFEHEISIISAITVSKKIDMIETFIFLDDKHRFFLIPKEKMSVKIFISKAFSKEKELFPCQNGFTSKGIFKTKLLDITYINLIHGNDGEDGILSSLLAFYNISFVGPTTPACVLSCDKYITKMYAKELEIKVLDYYIIQRGEKIEIPFNYPVIIKPLTLGSSIGMTIIRDANECSYALDTAFEYDDKAIIEPFIDGVKEYNLAGSLSHGTWNLSLIEEPKKGSFLDFNTKYLDFSRTKKVTQAEISNEVSKAIIKSFKKLYKGYFIGSIIRCDFFVIEDEVYLNEINSVPGSLANYLFDDFSKVIQQTMSNLQTQQNIRVNYNYIHKIHVAKGK